jgi:pilus assembly protein CpaB
MRRLRPWLILIVALASGAAAGLLALRYLQQYTPPLEAESRSGYVVVAARELGVGNVLQDSDVRLVEWPAALMPAGHLGVTQAVVGRGLVTSVQENEPLLESKLAPLGAGGGLPVLISDGMRAVAVRVDEVVGVAGFVLPDSRVDVLLTMNGPSGEPMTEVLLQKVRTLAAGSEVKRDRDGKPHNVPVITLLVTPEQAETLALAANQGRIQLALRNALDTATVSTPGARMGGLLGRPSASAGPQPRRSSILVRPTGRDSTVVEVYKGGARSLLKF